MAIEQGIWKLGDVPKKLKPAGLVDESVLEEKIMQDTSIEIGFCWVVRYVPPSINLSTCWP
jgi:hypothetical protein